MYFKQDPDTHLINMSNYVAPSLTTADYSSVTLDSLSVFDVCIECVCGNKLVLNQARLFFFFFSPSLFHHPHFLLP